MTHAAESTHWYDRQGRPAYEVVGAKGQKRPTTLRDARKLDYLPSVTTIIKQASAPGLEAWKREQVLLAALTLPRKEGESEESWLRRVAEDSKETARKAAERGTAIHAAIQGYFETGGADSEFLPYCAGAHTELTQALGEATWVAERSFAHPEGFGGKVDLSADGFVVDFKTKEFGPDDALKTWDEHAMQLGAYREGLNMPAARCAICYVSVTHPGLAKVIEIPEEELQRGTQMFFCLLDFWMAKNRYFPRFQKEAA